MINLSHSIGIIGGADGPTAIFVAGRFPWELPVLALAAAVLFIWLMKKRK